VDSISDTSFRDTVVLVGATAAASPLFKAAMNQLPDSVVCSPTSVADIGDALGRHCPKHVVLVADLNAVKVPDLPDRTPGGKCLSFYSFFLSLVYPDAVCSRCLSSS
jgi:hypothetical protein